MNHIHIEPAHELRAAFALWGLDQEPPLQTASATGWDVPVDLFPSIPFDLLSGALVDGYPHDRAMPQPAPARLSETRLSTGKAPRKRAARNAAATVLKAEGSPVADAE